MAAVGVPTTRALAVFGSSRAVYRDKVEAGAVVVRLAPSWVRFGSFELFHYRAEKDKLRELADYVIRHHFPDLVDTDASSTTLGVLSIPKSRRLSVLSHPTPESGEGGGGVPEGLGAKSRGGLVVDLEMNKYAAFFLEVVKRTAVLVAHWQTAGFVHGVMNTDNMSILGLTLDYGPFGFEDSYDPFWVSNSADQDARYRFEHQPKVAMWNLSKLGRTLAELMVSNGEKAGGGSNGVQPGYTVKGEDVVRELLKEFEPAFVDKFTELMRKKLGFRTPRDTDLDQLILPLLQLMADTA
ncbi:hypothetical protein HK104_007171, partial [Borealophlyctis nickersoniae]